ncbi:MAG: hypothetical protein AAB874_00560 [Patescibacteria group bacterium]
MLERDLIQQVLHILDSDAQTLFGKELFFINKYNPLLRAHLKIGYESSLKSGGDIGAEDYVKGNLVGHFLLRESLKKRYKPISLDALRIYNIELMRIFNQSGGDSQQWTTKIRQWLFLEYPEVENAFVELETALGHDTDFFITGAADVLLLYKMFMPELNADLN